MGILRLHIQKQQIKETTFYFITGGDVYTGGIKID